MATPAPKAPVYGYSMDPSVFTDYMPTAPSTPRPQQPFDINALLSLLGGQKPVSPPSGAGMGGIGPGPMIMPVTPNQSPLPIGMTLPPSTPFATPPMAPTGPVSEDPYSTTTSRDMGFGPDGRPPMPTSASGGGLDIQKLLAALRAMQAARQPVAPTIVPPEVAPNPVTPQGRSPSAGMGLDGLLNAIRASKRS